MERLTEMDWSSGRDCAISITEDIKYLLTVQIRHLKIKTFQHAKHALFEKVCIPENFKKNI